MKDLSVIVPFYNEQECIEAMYAALADALHPLGLDHEIIFVDDGSTDRTFSIAKSLAATDCRLCVIRLRKNYGQTAAMMAGIEHAEGAILITVDGDLPSGSVVT